MSEIQWLLELIQKVFGNEIVKWIVWVLLPFAVLFAFMWLIRGIIEIIKTTFIPLFYNAEQKRRIKRRQRFADHIESEIRRLNQREDWSDFRFAELEAEVEMEGARRIFSIIPFINRSSSGLRREKSLSKGLKQSQERIILLEGEPGSGKSVALRHVALDIARHAIKSESLQSLVPFYINLKELRRENDQPISRQTIESFIIKCLKRINDRDVDKFIDDEFQLGLENGSWFFLFDSFDEIPEILGAEEADSKIREYAEAISDFLHGLNICRGVVASRYFKGPSQVGWSRFRILRLTNARQKELIKRSELKPISEKLLLGNLETAKSEIQKFATNPLFLGLLIGYVQLHNEFPQHSDIVFDAYVKHRLKQDKERVAQRFGLSIDVIRQVAEEIAFCISASQDLGLSPTREGIKKSFVEHGFDANDSFDDYLDALEFMKLARSDTAEITGSQRVFTFSHRRFQEYFATVLVLNKESIGTVELLTNPRWRETAVVICQTQPIEVISQIIKEAWSLLDSYWDDIESLLRPIIDGNGEEIPIDFPWPQGCLHLLDLLQDGFANRKDLLPDGFRKSAGIILSLATLLGSLPHRIWALEVAGIVPTSDLLEIIRPAIADKSHFLGNVAYRQVARLDEIPDDIRIWIKRAILKKLLSLGVFRGDAIVYAQVSRLVDANSYIAVVQGIQFGYWIDIVSSIIISAILFVSAFTAPLAGNFFVGVITWRVVMIMFGFLALIIPMSIYSEDQPPMFRGMYVGVVLSLLFPLILLSRINSYFLVPVLYAPFVMSSIVTAIDLIPFEKSLIYVLFSPFFAVLRAWKGFLNAFHSLKTISFSQQSRRILLIGVIALIGLCILVIIPVRIWGIDKAGPVVATIFMLAWAYTIFQTVSKIIMEDRKYAKVWRTWLSISRDRITIDEIVDVLPSISMRYAYKLFETIRRNDLLQPSQENVHFIKQLIRLVENPFLDNEFSESLSVFLDDIRENKLKPLLLDELFQLVEKMESKLH